MRTLRLSLGFILGVYITILYVWDFFIISSLLSKGDRAVQLLDDKGGVGAALDGITSYSLFALVAGLLVFRIVSSINRLLSILFLLISASIIGLFFILQNIYDISVIETINKVGLFIFPAFFFFFIASLLAMYRNWEWFKTLPRRAIFYFDLRQQKKYLFLRDRVFDFFAGLVEMNLIYIFWLIVGVIVTWFFPNAKAAIYFDGSYSSPSEIIESLFFLAGFVSQILVIMYLWKRRLYFVLGVFFSGFVPYLWIFPIYVYVWISMLVILAWIF